MIVSDFFSRSIQKPHKNHQKSRAARDQDNTRFLRQYQDSRHFSLGIVLRIFHGLQDMTKKSLESRAAL